MDKPTELLSTYAARLTFNDLNGDAIHNTKKSLVDTIACGLGGFSGEPGRIARKMAQQVTGNPPAHILFTGQATAPEVAAFANTVMARYLDCNDMYRGREGGHPSDTMGAVLAVADALQASGRDTLLALALAYEMFCVIGEMQGMTPHGLDHTLHTAMASAMGTGKLLGLDAEGMANALAIALVSNVNLRATRAGHLSMWKAGAAANGARNGIFAAQIAALGMTGPMEPFQGKAGIQQLIGETIAVPTLGGQDHDFRVNHISRKYFPCDYHAQAPIWAALELRARTPVENISEILVSMYEYGFHEIGESESRWHVRDRETADHSLPYLVAAALLDGDVTPAQFTPERIADPKIHEIIARVKTRVDPELTRLHNENDTVATRLEATASDGQRHVIEIVSPKGHAKNPFTDDDVERKFHKFADGLMSRQTQQHALDMLWRLEEQPTMGNIAEALRL